MTLAARLRGFRRNLALYNAVQLFNPWFDLFTGGRRRPVTFDIDATRPELRAIDRAFPAIQAEADRIIAAREALPRYHELDTDLIWASGRHERERRWNVFMLYCYGVRPEENRRHCPATCAAVAGIPGLSQAFLSILDPGKSIPAHEGPTRAYLRYHLALRVPDRDPPRIRIRDLWYTWKEGESLLFDDSWNHEIVNRASTPRCVLIVDFLRPMPFPGAIVAKALQLTGRLRYGPRVVGNARRFPLDRLTDPGAAAARAAVLDQPKKR